MDRNTFLKQWEEHTGLYLVGENREAFLEECGQLLYLDLKHLTTGLRAAGRSGTFDLKFVEAVALNARGAEREEADNVIDFLKARQQRFDNLPLY